MNNKRVIIADDHSAIRSGVKHILVNEFASIDFGYATNAGEVFQLVKGQEWDVIILDIDLPGRNGLDILKQLKEESINIPVLVFSFHREEQIAVRALKSGAFGYLAKDAADTELVKAMHTIFTGKKYISPQVSEQLISNLENPTNKPVHQLLSDREFQTLLLIASGKTVTEIAEELSLSHPTISTYRARILQKTGMKNNAEITRYAIRQNLV
jgi:Response regulator containing a CheY-like receiver domain and an HTH DNA-binding domain